MAERQGEQVCAVQQALLVETTACPKNLADMHGRYLNREAEMTRNACEQSQVEEMMYAQGS